MARLHVLRVFCGEAGERGNPLGVFLDGAEVPPQRRQEVAAELGFSETVYVEDPGRGSCRIFTPGGELPFAGHPSVGTAWLLRREGHECDVLRPPAGAVEVRCEGELTFVAARPEWCPQWQFAQLGSAVAVEALEADGGGRELAYCWAWIDEGAGTVRARCFPNEAGILEDEATGSAAIPLCASLGRPLAIVQGEGSLLDARPLGDGRAEVGGRTALVEVRELAI